MKLKLTLLKLAACCLPSLLALSACSNSNVDPNDFREQNPFVAVKATDGESPILAQVDRNTHTIRFTFEQRTELEAVQVEFQMADGFKLEEPLSSKVTLNLDEQTTVRIVKGSAEYIYQLTAQAITPFEIHRGVNLSYWLQEGGGRWAVDRQKLQDLVDMGFDHFRIPLDEVFMFNHDGTINRENFDLLHEGLGWMDQLGVKAIVDLHALRSYDIFGSAVAEQRLYDCWKLLSSELKKYSVKKVAYEILNEPDDARNSALWNPIVAKAVKNIRQFERRRVLVISTVGWQDYKMVPHLEIPENDRNLIISFHYYLPMLLTHYGFPWSSVGDFLGQPNYPGSPLTKAEFDKLSGDQLSKFGWWYTSGQSFNAEVLRGHIVTAAEQIEAKGARSYCGEFACSSKIGASSAMRLQWLQDMVDALDAAKMPYAHWENASSGFGFKLDDGTINQPMLEILNGRGRYTKK